MRQGSREIKPRAYQTLISHEGFHSSLFAPCTVLPTLRLLFTLSGVAGLGLQLAWTRMLSLGLGQEIPATFGVLTTFFGGLAGGAWWWRRQRDDPRGQALRCAGLEGLIGSWALLSVWLIPMASEASWHLLGPAPSRALHWLACFLLPGLTLLPATAAMGATLPAIEHLASQLHPTDSHRQIGPLYAANTFGAVLGVGLAILWIQPNLGLPSSVKVFAGLNLLCALVLAAIGLARKSDRAPAPSARTPQPAPRPHRSTPASIGTRSPSRLGLLLWTTGLVGIGYELLATRMLSQVLEDTVFTYAAILSVYLIGTAFGAALQNRLAPDPAHAVPRLLVLLAATMALAGWTFPITGALNGLLRDGMGDGTVASILAEFGVAASVMALPSIVMGLLFGTLATSARASPMGLARGVAWNLTGAALAPIVVGLGLLPVLGSRWTLCVLGTAYLALLACLSLQKRHWIGVIGVAAALFTLPRSLHLQHPPPGSQILHLSEGPSDTVTVVRQPDGNRILRTNNRFTMGGTASAIAERRHGHLPLLFHPDPRSALFLGVGTGISFASLGTHPGLTADGVELVPEVAALQSAFAPQNDHGPQLRLHVADARRFVRGSNARYDVVIADLFHPARDGAAGLYTREHFAAIRQRLADGGLLCQWLPLFQLDLATLRSITATFLSVFPEAQALLLRFNADTPVLGLVGGTGPLRLDPAVLERRIIDPGLREALRPVALADVWPITGSWFADAAWLRDLAGEARINTDANPVVLFEAPRTLTRFPVPGHRLLGQLLDRPRAVPSTLFSEASPEWRKRFDDYLAARDAYLRGVIAEVDGDATQAEQGFWESLRLSRDFTSGYAQLVSRATAQARTDPEKARRILDTLTTARPDLKVASELRRRLDL